MKSDLSLKLLRCVALKEKEEEIGTHDIFVVKKKKVPATLLVFFK